ncbi:O-antigen ligase family protein [bacterium]|nr:O-antigen ligase family protein [bacterium]
MNGENKLKLLFLMLSSGIFFVLPPFLLGGVYSHTGTNLVIMFVGALSAFSYSVYLLATKKPFAISSVVFPLAAIVVFALFQLVPLPEGLLKLLSPQGYFFHSLEGGGARPLTMSIPDTIYSIFRILTLIFLSCILSRNIFLGNKKWKQNTIDTVILVSTVAIVVSVVLRFVQSETWLYGKLRHSGFLIESVLINPNHAAGYFGISGLLALTSIYTTTFQRKKIFYAALFFFHSAAVVATLSRGGISAYAAAVVLFFIINAKSFSRREGFKFYFPLAAIVLVFVFAYQTGMKLLEREFDFGREGYFDKFDSIARAWDYMGDFIVSGSGLGSFSKVFPYYHSNPELFAEQLENEPMQFIIETGIFFALLVFAAFICLIIFGKRETKRKNGLLSALFFVVMHNTLDFNLHNFATLFPVILVLVLLVKPVQLHKKNRVVALVSMALLSLATMFFTAFPDGQKLLGYLPEGESYPYETAVYLYPADYTVPMRAAIEKINSYDRETLASAVADISSMLTKSPKYYYGYYLNGLYFLRMGMTKQTLFFFRESVKRCNRRQYVKTLEKIYERLLLFNLQEHITEIVSIEDRHKKELERFVFKISNDNKAALDFANAHQDVFFISVIRNMLKEKRYKEALDLINKVMDENKELGNFERGQLLVYRGKISEHDKLYKEAFQLYMQGADLTRSFSDYLTAAYCSLKLDRETQEIVNGTLKNMTLKTSGNLGRYYRWLSRREFDANNQTAGFKYLERAAEVARNPYWQFELADKYAKLGMHYFASQNFLKIIREYPKFKPNEMKKRYESEKKKMENDEEKNLKEFMFRKKK